MTDRELIESGDGEIRGLLAAELLRKIHPERFCPCGVPKTVAPAFHRRSTNHDCVHHPRSRCWTCKAADRMIAGIEARLVSEVLHGPFEITRWEQ